MTDAIAVSEEFKMTELGPLPSEWQVARLGDAARVIMGQSPPGSTYNELGDGVPFLQGKAEFRDISPRHVKSTTRPLKIAPKGSVLMSVRAPVGDANIADIDYCIGRGLASISLREGDNKFLFYALTYRKGDIEKEGTGSTFKAINKSKIEDIKIACPSPSEQKKIASVLSAVQEAKEKTEAVIRATKELKKSLMKHLFTYGTVPLEEAENVPLKETEIGLVSEGWEVVRLGDLIRGTQYGISLRGTKQGLYSILRMNNLVDGKVDISDLQYVDLDDATFGRFKLKRGDILFNRTNSHELVGKTALFESDRAFVFASYLIRVVPDSSRLIPQYVDYYLNWGKTQARLKMLASRGVSQSNINATKLRNFIIPHPPIGIQQNIADMLSRVDERIQAEDNKKKALEELFRTLLNNLMTGKIRVNQSEVKT